MNILNILQANNETLLHFVKYGNVRLSYSIILGIGIIAFFIFILLIIILINKRRQINIMAKDLEARKKIRRIGQIAG